MESEPTAAEFVQRWEGEVRSIQTSLADPTLPSTSLSTLATSAQSLEAQLAAQASQNLPAYELARCERELKKVVEGIKQAREAQDGSGGRPKFSFKRSAGTGAATSAMSTSTQSSPATAPLPNLGELPPLSVTATPAPQPPPVPATALTLSNHTGRFLALPDLTSSAPSSLDTPSHGSRSGEALLISNLDDCFVDLTLPPSANDAVSTGAPCSALYIYNLCRSVVLLGKIEGSVMMHGCENCVLLVGCHQLRIHDSSSCTVYVHTRSTPIIERSTRMTFGPYPSSVLPLSSSSSGGLGSYAAVQDFDYPFATAATPSPNFRVEHGHGHGHGHGAEGQGGEQEWMRSQRGWTSREARSWDWKVMLKEAVEKTRSGWSHEERAREP